MIEISVIALASAVAVAIFIHPVLAIVPLLLGAIAANRMGYRHQGEAVARAIGKPLPPAEDVGAKLVQLAELRDRGAITAEDYESKKAELLARL